MENINWICKSTTVNNNIVWMCQDRRSLHPQEGLAQIKEHFEATTNTVQLFSATNYGGNSSSFGIGRYTSTQLDKIGPKALQSIKVPSGLVALLYQNADFTGYGKAITGENSDLSKVTDTKNTGFNWSNQMQSLIVQPYVALPTSISDKMPKISLVASDPNSFMTAVSGAILTRIDDKSYLYVDPNNKDNTFWYDASDLQIIPPFTISAISDLQLWFDARDPAANGSQPADGSKLSTWNDKSNNKFNTTKVNGNPIYNKNGVVFDGNSYFDLPDGSIPFNDSSYAVYVVGSIVSSSGVPGMIGGGNVNGPTGAWLAITGHQNRNFETAWNNRNIQSGCPYNENQTFLHYSLYESGGQRSIGFNGTVCKTDTPSGPRVQPNNNNVLGWASQNIGKMIGSISEVLVFNISHTDTQRQMIEGYLAWKWGLQANLPNNHPFKSAAPSGSTAFPQITNYLENVSFVRIAPSNSDSGMSYIEISQIVIKDDKDVNIAKTGTITQNGGQASLLQNYPVQKLIDGNEQILEWPNQWAPIQNSPDAKSFFIEVALPKPTNIKEVNILTRQSTPWYFNSVMQTVQFLDSNRNLLATRSFPGNSATKQVINKLGPNIGTPGLIKFVRIEKSDNSKAGSIQIAQLQVFDLNNVNVAKYQIAKSKDGYPAEYAVDGVELNGPGDRGGQMSIANDWWELTLGAPTAIKQIKFYNRGCCYERMEPFRISLLDKDRNVIYNTPNFVQEGVQIFNITGKAVEKS